MIEHQIQNVTGRSKNQASVQKQIASNISKKSYAVDTTPFEYQNMDGANSVRYPKTFLRDFMFSQLRGSGNPSVKGGNDPVSVSAKSPLTSVYSIQRLHDVFAPGCTKRGPDLDNIEVEKARWEMKKAQIESNLVSKYGQLSNQNQILAQNQIFQNGVFGEQLVFQQFNHIAVENMLTQIAAPTSCQPTVITNIIHSGTAQPSLQVK